ncbi:ribbon-helix-helix domain-containing protein [Clostridium tetani]|uniref:ribbon-helix-helix domain-containing protein n=1 Tax=Clostridium tetani TaxID=1513 RepID=UPI001024FC6C|nr:ribbon-helix-helix protein, CopG family [Clostridium tetani]RXI70528.1 hypothetical protein DP127_09505 [Clostridium tetani]
MISKKNTRIKVTVSKKLNAKLKEIAEYEGRSVSNLVLHIIKEYVSKNYKDIYKE